MAARKRRENETFKQYRENLKHEDRLERVASKKYIVKHKSFQLPDAGAIGGYVTKIIPTTYRRPAFKP